jgi:ubiquinone/menaquinone biosynthesis C-methylase UbiE
MVAMTREATRGFEVAVAEGALPHLALPAGQFDGVTANFVINHVPDPRGAVRELARLVRRGGSVAVTVWTDQPTAQAQLYSQALAAADAVAVAGRRPVPALDFERSVDGLAGILRQAGLVPRDCRELAWDWDVTWESLWAGIAAGVASIGATYLAQADTVRLRIEEQMHHLALALEVDGLVHLPSRAAYAMAERP